MLLSVLDVQGLKCPLPILKTRRAMDGLAKGETLEVLATDRGIVRDMQHYLRVSGNQLVAEEVRGDVYFFVLKKQST